MSLAIDVYTKEISDSVIPKMIGRLNKFGMKTEVHPDFSFQNQSGFLPFRFTLHETNFKSVAGKTLRSGFELYVDDFDLATAKEKIQPKQGLVNRLLRRKKEPVAFAPNKMEKLLQGSNKIVSFVWHAKDDFELRFAYLTSYILAELTNSIIHNTEEDEWYVGSKKLTAKAFAEIKEIENAIEEGELSFEEFEDW